MPNPPVRDVQLRRALGTEARQALADVFEQMGGTEGLLEWAKAHPSQFYLFLWPRLLPKEVKATVDVQQNAVAITAVTVADPAEALSILERARDASDAHCGRGGAGDGEEVAGQLAPHAVRLQEADGGGAGVEQASSGADAA